MVYYEAPSMGYGELATVYLVARRPSSPVDLRVFDGPSRHLGDQRQPERHIHQPAVDPIVMVERIAMIGRRVRRLGWCRELLRPPDAVVIAFELEPREHLARER